MPRHSPPNDASDKPAEGAEPADEGAEEKAVSKLPPKAVLDALPAGASWRAGHRADAPLKTRPRFPIQPLTVHAL